MERCRVAVTSDMLLEDGSVAFPDYSLDALAADSRIEIVRLAAGDLIDQRSVADIDVLISVPMTAAIKEASFAPANRLAAIVRVGVGFEDVNVTACTANDVALIIPAESVRRPTAVAALTLILALANRLLDKHRLSTAGPAEWHRRAELRGSSLDGRILGLVGCGNIGSDLINIARPLGLRVIIADPNLSVAGAKLLSADLVTLDQLMAAADFVSIHCPLSSETRHLIDARRLALMKPSAYLVNTARGGIIDQSALVEALTSGLIAGAGLDVFETEPPAADDPLLKLDNVVLSAHALNWTRQLDIDLSAANVQAVLDLLNGLTPGRIVNPRVLDQPGFKAKRTRLAAIGSTSLLKSERGAR